ncbi:FKBP-type peptidyl-prolyl cis-trans isomerase FklB [Tenacibaculum adriaticum]|uniref:Peptidyl-prolyl cis-trans isomerase n=1 Tax=Tenacibaculum adriaticum TaxID=413713 RepID=A0A5S5DTB9_9FLAO|nr:FKBP-type peptidyl-prolyl cis-trans isomerase [Tenacibaculum adriaticum]TYP98246.1 FKBP-type peptidyl-prolyl cis-trans isomerase FklB [Tenacibaculum adriaticum]
MKISKLIAVAALGLTVVSCNSQLKTKSSLATEIDSVSYALGLNMAEQMKVNAEEVDADLFVQGYLNGQDSSNLLIPSKDVKKVLDTYFQKKRQEMMKKKQEEMAKQAEEKFGENKKAGEDFLAENKIKPGVQTTESGLQYIVLKEGKGASPKATDKVKVHYHGTLLDGTVFDSSVDRKEPAEFGVSQVIKGWTEGLQLMNPGAKYKFFIPQDLAYGAQQRGAQIKPFSALVFEVELLEVK